MALSWLRFRENFGSTKNRHGDFARIHSSLYTSIGPHTSSNYDFGGIFNLEFSTDGFVFFLFLFHFLWKGFATADKNNFYFHRLLNVSFWFSSSSKHAPHMRKHKTRKFELKAEWIELAFKSCMPFPSGTKEHLRHSSPPFFLSCWNSHKENEKRWNHRCCTERGWKFKTM